MNTILSSGLYSRDNSSSYFSGKMFSVFPINEAKSTALAEVTEKTAKRKTSNVDLILSIFYAPRSTFVHYTAKNTEQQTAGNAMHLFLPEDCQPY
jgi:hypothetical protein